MGRGRSDKTIEVMGMLTDVLSEHYPMTVRQAYYQLVSRHVIANTRSQYQRISNLLVEMRRSGRIPWYWVEDRIRKPRVVSMWSSLEQFGVTAVAAYRRDVWDSQDTLVEVWLEKDALSGIFEGITADFGVTLNVGRG